VVAATRQATPPPRGRPSVYNAAVSKESGQFVSRAGEKLDAALEAFGVDVAALTCADFGCNVGGFTDCLLQRGAARVIAVDTGYGALAWKLRKDDRVVVMERTNALHADPPEPVDLLVSDVAWTPQRLIVPAAMKWLTPGGRIVSLLKPHYELAKLQRGKPRGPLTDAQIADVCCTVCEQLTEVGCDVRAMMRSVLKGKGGNPEFPLLLTPN
jgi:23S rRNA (cytidine1920-2'-O)/16S rRNA (cytidine1409-2'-O)-methyltransferase